MKKWVVVLLVSSVVVLLVAGGIIFYFLNKYAGEISALQSLKAEADVLFNQGIVGPGDCLSFTGCVNYCNPGTTQCCKWTIELGYYDCVEMNVA